MTETPLSSRQIPHGVCLPIEADGHIDGVAEDRACVVLEVDVSTCLQKMMGNGLTSCFFNSTWRNWSGLESDDVATNSIGRGGYSED